MAYKGYRVVCFTPAGRRRTMSVLLDNLSRFTDIVDEYQVWMNTDEDQVEDRDWLRQLPDIYDWVKVVDLPKDKYEIKPKQLRTGLFYAHNTIDQNTIYIRLDDDIVFLDNDFFINLLDFRLSNPSYFLVMANILNNAMLSYIYQHLGVVPDDDYKVEAPYCMDPVGWRSGPFAELLHRGLIARIAAGTTRDYFFDHADLKDAARFSISCFCFFGRDFAEFAGIIGQRREGVIRHDEEIWLTEIYPTLNRKLNTICGSALCAHYTFLAQRPYIDKTDILETYRAIAKGKLSESYYDLLAPLERPRQALKLETVKLTFPPQLTSYGGAMQAELKGFHPVRTEKGVEIVGPDGNVYKRLIGSLETITDSDIDRALAGVYFSTKEPDGVSVEVG